MGVRNNHVKMTVTEKVFDRKITELHNLNSKIRKLGKDLENELNRKTSDAKGSKEKAKKLFNELTYHQQVRNSIKRKNFNNFHRDSRCQKRSFEREMSAIRKYKETANDKPKPREKGRAKDKEENRTFLKHKTSFMNSHLGNGEV